MKRFEPFLGLAALVALVGGAAGQGARQLRASEALLNADFELPAFEGAKGLPFWRVRSGTPRIEGGVLILPPGSEVSQPIAAPPGTWPRSEARGSGSFEVYHRDSAGRRAPAR